MAFTWRIRNTLKEENDSQLSDLVAGADLVFVRPPWFLVLLLFLPSSSRLSQIPELSSAEREVKNEPQVLWASACAHVGRQTGSNLVSQF